MTDKLQLVSINVLIRHTHTYTHTYSQTMSCGVMSLWGNGVRTEWSYGVALVG